MAHRHIVELNVVLIWLGFADGDLAWVIGGLDSLSSTYLVFSLLQVLFDRYQSVRGLTLNSESPRFIWSDLEIFFKDVARNLVANVGSS